MIIVLFSNIPNWQEALSQVLKETNFEKLDMKSRVYFTRLANLLPARIKGQKSDLSKTIDDILFKKLTLLISWLHFLGLITSIMEN